MKHTGGRVCLLHSVSRLEISFGCGKDRPFSPHRRFHRLAGDSYVFSSHQPSHLSRQPRHTFEPVEALEADELG